MTKQLPERPDLEQLKKQAKELVDQVRAGRPEAIARIGRDKPAAFARHDALRVLAREYGFESWAKLKLHVETRTEEAAEARLIGAALDGEGEAVAGILAERPGLGGRSVFAAAALGEAAAMADWLGRDPGSATRKGGPRGWEPLLYLCFGRGGDEAVRGGMAERLIALGADPNAHWIDPSWPKAPLPALYGATGVNNYPRLARALLRAGANPNDSESRYHAAEHNHRESLAVLAEFGADFSARDEHWSNTPLYFLLGWFHPASAVREGIRWMLEHGTDPNVPAYINGVNEVPLHLAVRNGWELATIELLLTHGADPSRRRADGRTAYALAVQGGREDVAALLLTHGAQPEVEARDRFLGACMRADERAARAVLATEPGLISRLSAEEQRLVHEAAKSGRADAIVLMAAVGLDLRVMAEQGETALHIAAWHGQAAAARALIGAGVELNGVDKQFDAPPIGWCAHGSQFCKNPTGDYPAVAQAMVDAGARVPAGTRASPEVMAVLRPYLKRGD